MKQRKLEEYIERHKAEFDSESPPAMVWMNLEKELNLENEQVERKTLVREVGRNNIFRMMQVAAMFIVVMGVGLIIGMQINSGGNVYGQPQLQEFVEAEKHYNNKIDNMWTAVKSSGLHTNNVEKDLQSLNEVYHELKEELLNGNGDNTNEVVNSMINNYRTKIDLLETVLNKSNQQIKNKDDKVDEI